jgi:hypothetical protein
MTAFGPEGYPASRQGPHSRRRRLATQGIGSARSLRQNFVSDDPVACCDTALITK